MELIQKATEVQAAETASAGFNMTYAPMLDIARDARWGRIAEGNGEDPYLASAIAVARVRAYQGENLGDTLSIASCIKHFAAYGATEDGRDYNTVNINERTLRDYYLPPFKAAVDAGAAALMPSFNEYDGVPLTANQFLLKKVLREEWGFEGVILTDYHAMTEMIAHGYSKDSAQAAEQAMQATVDMDMEGYAYLRHLARLVKEGRVSEQQVDDAVRRTLNLKAQLGLFDDPYRYLDEKREAACTMTDAHKAVAFSGRPLDLSRESELADALLEAWQPGTMCAEALYRILYGQVNPSGHLTTSFPRTSAQEPLYYYQKPTGRPVQKEDGTYNFDMRDGSITAYISAYTDCNPTPLYPFGFGLSYTTFEYSDLELSSDSMPADGKITASIHVKNTGNCYGKTVAQLYIRDMVGSVTRPLKMLKGFEKIGLQPGESKVLHFEITAESLSFWRQDMTYGSEAGEFRVYIGDNANVTAYRTFSMYD